MNLETLTKISALIRDHLSQQKARSHIGRTCKLRGSCERKCAIGAVITEHFYFPDLEHRIGEVIVPVDDLNFLQKAIIGSLRELGFSEAEWTSDLGAVLRFWQAYHDATAKSGHAYKVWLEHSDLSAENSPGLAHDWICHQFNAAVTRPWSSVV